MTPIKPFHFRDQSGYDEMVLLDCWVGLTAFLEASTSILEAAGLDTAVVRLAMGRGDRALVAIMRRDRIAERLS